MYLECFAVTHTPGTRDAQTYARLYDKTNVHTKNVVSQNVTASGL